ncbi:MAG: tetratricopeptide repeat protein [Blastocatellia bacterium]
MKSSLITLLFALTPIQQPAADPALHFNRAVALQQEGKLAEAADEYRALLKLKPDYAEAQANLGVVLSRLGKYDEAIVAYESALKLAPHLTPIQLNLGIAHYRAGQYAKAAETLRSFLEKKPDSLQARQLYGLSLVEIGQDEDAIIQLELTLDAAPQETAVLYSLGLAYLRLNKPGWREMIERLAAFPAGVPTSHLLRGQSLIAGREYERAIEELQKAAALNPDLPRLQYSLGLAYEQLKRNKEALVAFENELKRSPQDFLTLYYLAYLNETEGNLNAAQRHLDSAVKLAPESPEVNAVAGKILFKQGKAAEAVKPLEFAAAKKPNDHELRYTLARVYQQLGRKEDAAREFAEVQRLKAEQLKRDRANTPKP